MESVILVYSAPIPIGHRVEVTWLEGSPRAFRSGVKERPHQPIVRDLDTQIEYMPDWVLEHGGSKRPHEALRVGDVKPELQPARTLAGVVRRCRIVTVRWSEYEVQTHLEIEPRAQG